MPDRGGADRPRRVARDRDGGGVGLVVAALVTLLAGTPLFWLAYLRDLVTVAGSEVRPQPGLPFAAVVGAPAYMGGSLVPLLGGDLPAPGRAAGSRGWCCCCWCPAFFYVQYQNWGNDPQWLGLLGLLLVALRPAARGPQRARLGRRQGARRARHRGLRLRRALGA